MEAPWGLLRASWCLWGRPWGLLRASLCLWGRLASFVGASWGRLGGFLGRLESVFRGRGGKLGTSSGVLDRLGSVLEASWKPPGPFWAEKAAQHGSKMAPKTEAKSIKNKLKIDHLLDATWNHHLSVFHRFLESKTEPCW